MSKNQQTTVGSPVITEPCKLDPEFVDCVGLKRLFSIGRTSAYELINLGLIRSVCLRKPGHVRGRRLFHVESVRNYLASLEESSTPAATGPATAERHDAALP